MGFVSETAAAAARMVLGGDADVYRAVRTTLSASVASTALSALLGVPAGAWIGVRSFPGKRALVTVLNTLLALPTVVIGLCLYALLSRQGPLGTLGLLFTPAALVIGQTVLALPIVVSYSVSAIQGADPRVLPTVLTLGATRAQALWALLSATRFAVMAAVITAFGRVISEVGVAMMLGGNIRGQTRTLTTAIALETSKGEFAFGLALGMILLAVALAVNLALHRLQQR